MADNSTIEWTEATWNPVTGCDPVSPGCAHCYAKTFAERWRNIPGHPYEQGFDLRLWPERLDQPLKWTRPRMIFVNSMSDLFHEGVPLEYIEQIFDVMRRADHHTFQILTKRPSRVADMAGRLAWPSNVWQGTSVEDARVIHRLEELRGVPAAVRFLSCEPLIGPLENLDLTGIGWLIAGGESGPGYRRVDPEWIVNLRDQCVAAAVPFFFKQWGGITPKAGGRILDGVEWSQMPEGIASCPGGVGGHPRRATARQGV